MSTFANNLRRLRLEKNLTQERAAELLGVSPQSVSRWECGNTLPDVLLLPQIARLYGVSVDDLYREDARAYPSYAQRLLAVYEASGRTEDFLAAEQEFARIPAGSISPDDLRAWGVLYHYMTKHSAALARQKLEQAMAHPERTDMDYCRSAQQKIALLCDLGQGKEEAAHYDRLLAEHPADWQYRLLCTAAHHFAGENEQALAVALEAIARFPEQALFHVYAGDICRALSRYEEAFAHWEQALSLDHTYLDAKYAMGFCYEELGKDAQAEQIWTALSAELEARGMKIEAEFPLQLAQKCRARLENTNK